MRELGIKVGTEKAGSLLHGVYSASGPRPETVPVSNEKRAIVDLGAPWEDVFGRMSLHGQLFVRDERVYGYFTQAGYALTKNLSVCFVLVDEKDLQPGVRKLSSSGSDSARIPSRVVVRAVSRLE